MSENISLMFQGTNSNFG